MPRALGHLCYRHRKTQAQGRHQADGLDERKLLGCSLDNKLERIMVNGEFSAKTNLEARKSSSCLEG